MKRLSDPSFNPGAPETHQIVIQITTRRKRSKHTKFVQDGFCTPVSVFRSILTEGELGNCNT